ncbi:MAG: SPFH/Band 7/PHB domain protein, partial [Pedococcus sp.]
QKLLAYQYLQVLPQIARGDSNKMWIIPSELTDALRGIGGALGQADSPRPDDSGEDGEWVDPGPMQDAFDETMLEDPMQALAEARGQAGRASREATEHANPAQRVQPPIPSPADAVPEFEAPTAPMPAPTDPEPTPPAPPTEPPPVAPEDGPRGPAA